MLLKKSGLLDVVRLYGPVIRQVVYGRKCDICQDRVQLVYGDNWDSSQYSEFSKTLNKLRTDVKLAITDRGVKCRGQYFITFVYAAALCPQRSIIAFLIQCMATQDVTTQTNNVAKAEAARKRQPAKDTVEAVEAVAETSHTMKETGMGCLFGINERSQKHPGVVAEILATSVSEKLRKVFTKAMAEEIVQNTCFSLVSRHHMTPLEDELSEAEEDFFPQQQHSMLDHLFSDDFVSDNESKPYTTDSSTLEAPNPRLEKLLQSVTKWLPVFFTEIGTGWHGDLNVGRKELTKAHNRRDQEYKAK